MLHSLQCHSHLWIIPSHRESKTKQSIWLVAPLISKLPSAIQGRVLKVAGQVLESGGWCREQKTRRYNGDNQSLLGHQPFLSLVLTCLKGQEEGQREGLLSSLHQQLSQVIVRGKSINRTAVAWMCFLNFYISFNFGPFLFTDIFFPSWFLWHEMETSATYATTKEL